MTETPLTTSHDNATEGGTASFNEARVPRGGTASFILATGATGTFYIESYSAVRESRCIIYKEAVGARPLL